MKDTKTYGLEWVAMQNSVVECFKHMNIDEKRILLISSVIARIKNATVSDYIKLSAEDYAMECGIDINNAYSQIDLATKQLVSRQFSYVNADGKKVTSNWVMDKTYYSDGEIHLRFTESALIALKELDKVNPYTKYKKEVALALKLTYSIDLYHLAKKNEYKEEGFILFLEDLKKELGFPESYKRMDNLKAKFLIPTLEEINDKTDIFVTYENVKKGRSIIGFRFFVKRKEVIEQEANEILSMISEKATNKKRKRGLTDKQIAKLATRKHEFVERNQHMIIDNMHDYYEAFESFKLLLKDKEKVNLFKDVDVFLSLQEGDELPVDNTKKPKEVVIGESNFRLQEMKLKGKTETETLTILMRQKLKNESLEQTFMRVKKEYE